MFVQAEYAIPLAESIGLSVGAQFHDQQSVGDELVGSFATWNVGAHAKLSVWDASVDVMFHPGLLPDIRLILNWPLTLF